MKILPKGFSILLGCLALTNPLAAIAAGTNLLQSVSPATASQGTIGLLVTFTLNTTPPPPATNVPITGITLGDMAGTVGPHTNQFIVTAQFDVPGNESVGTCDATVNFAGGFVGYKAAGFTVAAASALAAEFSASPTSGVSPMTVNFSDASVGTVTNRLWNFGDGSTSSDLNPVHTYSAAGSYNVSLTIWGALGSNTLSRADYIQVSVPPTNGAYVVVDTGQTNCYNDTSVISPPAAEQPFYGQDAQIEGRQPAYTNNGDGTISDLNTGLMWVQARGAQMSWAQAVSNAANCRVGGYTDWRMPTIKELYSLVQFTGANGMGFTNLAGYVPFIDTNYFGFAYGPGTSETVGQRVIDAQDWSATPYVSTTMNGAATIFGFNFTDGRIKGYPEFNPANASLAQSNYVRYVRGNPDYGINNFVINGDGTISDKATQLMWARNDSGFGMDWSNALSWVQTMNASNYLGYSDWRLPNAKELQTIVDYSRSPDTTGSAAINPVFNCTAITNEAGQLDYPWYWSGTTMKTSPSSAEGVYLCFGRAMGYMGNSWVDAHGAGAQRSDPKDGSVLSSYTYVPYGYFSPLAPQGDAVRIFNYVRLVRDIPASKAWRFAFVGDTHVPLTTIPAEIASAVANDDAKFLIVAGDLTQSGASANDSILTSELTTWRSEMAPLFSRGIPVYVIRGNHENDVPDNLFAWTNFFTGAYAMPDNGPTDEVDLTYSTALTYSNALFVGLDDYVNIHRVNQPWLNQVLATNRLPHIFVFGHEPAFKAFHTDCLGAYPDERNTFWQSLTDAGAKVYLCGHDHFFNVARIDDGDGNPANDLYQFIVGTGGSTNWPPKKYSYDGTNAPYAPVNLWNITRTWGYLLVEISGTGSNDLGVTMTWKQRTYDTNTASYIYVATTNVFRYTATNRYLDSVGDGIPDWWRAEYFGGNGTTTNADSSAAADPDHDGVNNLDEYIAGTNPTNAASCFRIESFTNDAAGFSVAFQSSWGRDYTLYSTTNLAAGPWSAVPSQTAILGDGSVDVLTNSMPDATTQRFYRVGVSLP